MKSAWTDKGTRVLLGVVAGLLALNVVASVGGGSQRTAVAAGLPDSGAQLERLIDEVAKLNKTVEKLQGYLESGKMTVKVDKPEK